MKLIIGNRNYSSWSLRPWLLMKQAGIPFEEEMYSFNAEDFDERLRTYSPAGRVPVLIDGEIAVWDSLAIAEYLAERFPAHRLWPEAREARARARSISAEMHSGFASLREQLPMNCELRYDRAVPSAATRADIERILDIWRDCRERHAATGPFLFGHFTVADAFYAPVVRRFVSYGVELPSRAAAYARTIDELPAMREWMEAALAEHDFVTEDEPYRDAPPSSRPAGRR
jgi:glutathione S-transferase